jgi:hypothetical protein
MAFITAAGFAGALGAQFAVGRRRDAVAAFGLNAADVPVIVSTCLETEHGLLTSATGRLFPPIAEIKTVSRHEFELTKRHATQRVLSTEADQRSGSGVTEKVDRQ